VDAELAQLAASGANALKGGIGKTAAAVRVALGALPVAARRPVHTVRMLRCLLGSESWNWQFRGVESPAILLRQTWERVP